MTYLSPVLLFLFLFPYIATCNHTHNVHDSQSLRGEEKNTTAPNKVKIVVYYETLCPASVDFMMLQLVPAVQQLGEHLDLRLVPYGHAKTRRMHGRYQFACQHGPAECYGNMLHACSIQASKNATTSVLFNSCLMQFSFYRPGVGYDYGSALNWCGYILKLPLDDIRHCTQNHSGALLLKQYGDETHRLKPTYVPYVVLDGNEFDGHLESTICQKLNPKPEACLQIQA